MLGLLGLAVVAVSGPARPAPTAQSQVLRVASKDGTPIAVECAGAGPRLLIVHGGTGDRTRWTPMLPLLAHRFTVCAMDRRGHGASGDRADYSLRKEAEDVAAVAAAAPGPVFVLGHSFGGVTSFEAAFLTDRISKLVLYEPPLQNPDHSAALARMEAMIRAGDRDLATVTFMRDVVGVSPSETEAMKARPSWPGLVASIATAIRQDRALSAYRFDPVRVRALKTPTLLLLGSETTSPSLKLAVSGVMDALPNRTLVVLQGQEHNAMDSDREPLARVLGDFLLGPQTVP